MSFTKTQRGRLPRHHSVREIAEAYGVDERTVRRWIEAGDLRAHKPGGHWRIHPDDLDAVLAARRNARTSNVR